ncbi:Fat storage-inducing transmembrane protein [Phascolomyces articulosus]|uniref:Fat storage-inducing transmembrane protein n=1 Tax=Phascolomyces articulosus TaxID=60185 RepID=A0AAD5JZS5_9FUNG|nr:Fat storage-inducing transmembrane protein [Phascolomyces articulosus]
MTQWLLGPSFIERVFVATGGSCTDLLSTQSEGINVNQYAACKRAGGTWNGGHDVSGHCVLLILSSLFLWEEAVAWAFYSIPAVQRLRANTSNRNAWYSVLTVFGLLVFWWWMLVVTSVYFHGHFELLSGCFFGVLGWAIVYIGILPRLPQVGLPPIQL